MREVFCANCGESLGFELTDQTQIVTLCPICTDQWLRPSLEPREED